MAQQTDDTKGFPRLPYTRTSPTEEEVKRAVAQGQARGEEGADLLQRVLGVFQEYATLNQRNHDFAARFWGTADVAENASEHWQYIRDGDFAQGTLGAYKWTQNASILRSLSTSSIPYNADRALILSDTSGAENWVQQSCSAPADVVRRQRWMQLTSGAYACLRVLENSGSSTARTHAACTQATQWKKFEIPFKTYKGTTRLTYRMVVATNAGAAFCLPMLEKGRRGHESWRPHFLDRGGLVTSVKTAGSASFTGNLTLSGSGGARVRQVAGPPKKFIVGAPNALTAASSVTPVSATGAVGSSANYARQDHVHRGVKMVNTAASASANGALRFSAGGAVRVRQVGTTKFVWSTTGLVGLASTTPAKVSSAGTVGVGTTAARSDHVHRGVTSLFKSGGASADGRVGIVGSGGVTVAVSGSNLRVHSAAGGSSDTTARYGIARCQLVHSSTTQVNLNAVDDGSLEINGTVVTVDGTAAPTN